MSIEHVRRYICLAIIALAPLIVHAQEPRYRIETISTHDDHSPNKANWMLKDRYGFIWIASPDGLYRYDGYSFRPYRHDPFDSTSLSSSHVGSIAEDSTGNLWIATSAGLNLLDRRTGRFSHFRHNPLDTFSLSRDDIWYMAADRYGVWIITIDGFDRYDIRTRRFRHVGRGPWRGLPAGSKMWAYVDRAGYTWITTVANMDGHYQRARKADTCLVFLSRFDPSRETFTTWPVSTHGGSMFTVGERNGMPILTYDRIDTNSKAMVYVFDAATGRLTPFDVPSRQLNRREGIQFFMGEVDADQCWYLMGINNSPLPPKLFHEPLIPFATTRSAEHSDMVRSFVPPQPIASTLPPYGGTLRDRSGTFWMTTDNGIIRAIAVDSSIRTWPVYRDNQNNPTTLSSWNISSVWVDRYGVLWVGTGNGLNRYEPATGRWKHYFHAAQSGSMTNSRINVIYEDHDGRLLIGTDDGLAAYNREKDTFYNPYQSIRWSTPEDAAITSLLRDRRRRLWIGTRAAVVRLDSMGRIERWFRSDTSDRQSITAGRVRNILEDRYGEIWIMTNSGLCRWMKGSERFRYYEGSIDGLHADGAGDLLFSRGDRIGRYNRERDTFTTIIPDGYTGANFYDIQEDDAGDLWIGTRHGLVRWNRRANTFRRYDDRDGLRGDVFAVDIFKSSDGTLYCASDNGLNAFNPAALRDNPAPPLAITTFQIFDSLVAGEMFDGDTIRLDYTQNFFSFEFIALDYDANGKNRYAYILEGIDPQWVQTGSDRRIASYTEVAPGVYTFRVRGSNKDGVWNERGITITIIIAPPWWETWWFRITASMVVMALAITALRMRTSSIRRREREKRELAVQAALEMQESERQRIARDLHDGVGQMLAAAGINLTRHREMIGRNGSAQQDGVQAPLDLAMGIIGRAGEDVRAISHALGTSTVREMGLVAAIDELLVNIEAQENTSFEFATLGMEERPSELIEIGLFRVTQELIANVLRHAKASEATVQIVREGEEIRLTVEDNGVGFDLVATNGAGMGRHNIAARVAAMGGQLHYDSMPGHGTTVTVVVKEE